LLSESPFLLAPAALLHNINFYPPFYMLAPLPFFFFGGLNFHLMAMVNLFYLGLLFFAVYRIGKMLYGVWVGLFCTVLLFFIPSILGFSRVTHMNIALTSILAFNVYLLLRSEFFSSRKFSLLSGITAGAGVLFSFEYWVFVSGPLLVCLAVMLFRKNKDISAFKSAGNFLLFLCGFLLVAAVFYLPSFFTFSSLNFKMAAPGIAISGFDPRAFYSRLAEYTGFLRIHLLTPNLSLFLLAAVFLNRKLFKPAIAVIFFGWFLISFFLVALWPYAEPRFLLPLLPATVLISAALLAAPASFFRKRPLKIKLPAIFILGVFWTALVAVFFAREHPLPENSAQLAFWRHNYGMRYPFSPGLPSEELFSFLKKNGTADNKMIIIFDNSRDTAPLILELIYGELRNPGPKPETETAMSLAVSAWHAGMTRGEIIGRIRDYYKKSGYVLYVSNSIAQETDARCEYESRYNDILKGAFNSGKRKMREIWRYNDPEGFFTESLVLFRKQEGSDG
ncbi:MAG: hypothetical protein WC432_05445, partial [Candidatus Omnitrophota bacterium]